VMCAGSVAFPFEGAPGAVTVGLRPEHLRFTGSGLSGRVVQLEPMGREILYVVDTDAGYLRVLEHARSRPMPSASCQDRFLTRRLFGVRRRKPTASCRRAGGSAGMMAGSGDPADADARANRRAAPSSDPSALATERQGSTQSGRSCAREAWDLLREAAARNTTSAFGAVGFRGHD
jgi:hypothetical protein